ncbi:electron transfer flavoprotein subunit alpha/FixB family protein [Candidatus Bathyarchaeota archaeon]|nr:electron transfer flavoprotein subunit alpha/FixB family protein [Candidatus Bathyarchaeota archaeon]
MTGKGVMVYSEDKELELQLLRKGREFADKLNGPLSTVSLSREPIDADELIRYGADRVFLYKDPGFDLDIETYRAALLMAVKRASPEVILIGSTRRGRELAPRIASALGTGCMTECIELEIDERGDLLARRLVYGGSAVALERSRNRPHVATVPPRVFRRAEPSERTGEVMELGIEKPKPRTIVVERREKSRGGEALENARIIVAAGRGFRRREDLKLLEELARVLGAEIGCTRPLAADNGWLNEWIGISGHKVKPQLYIACGISGTVQHLAGIRDSQVIVSINKDESANIFQASDYGLVGDLYTILPLLTGTLRRIKGEPI